MMMKDAILGFLAGAGVAVGARSYHDDRAATAAAISHLSSHFRQTADDLGQEIDRLGVKLQMGPTVPVPSAVEPAEPPDLWRQPRRDTAKLTGRRDSFDRRPSAGEGMERP